MVEPPEKHHPQTSQALPSTSTETPNATRHSSDENVFPPGRSLTLELAPQMASPSNSVGQAEHAAQGPVTAANSW